MANTGVRGRVTDSAHVGIADLLVAAFDVEVIARDALLKNTATANDPLFPGLVRTSADGSFEITYSPSEYGLESKPDIRVRVYDSVKRLVHETQEFQDVADDVLVLPDIVITREDAEGWLVTLGKGTPQFLETGNSVEFLIDNEDAWREVTIAIDNADTDVNFLMLLLDPGNLISKFEPAQPVIGSPTVGRELAHEILSANELPRELPVRIVMWDWGSWPVPNFDKFSKEFFEDNGSFVRVNAFSHSPLASMHCKSTVIRTSEGRQGFLIASPFLQEYFDSSLHKIDDPRRGLFGCFKNQIRVPIHDVSLRIKGPALSHIDAMFGLHWNKVRGPHPDHVPIPTPPSQPENIPLQIVRSLPGNEFPGMDDGEAGILEAYLRAINMAEDFIYFENQYITCDEIADALKLAIKQKPNLQVIWLINNKVDTPLYGPLPIVTELPVLGLLFRLLFDGWQTNLIERLLGELTAEERNRIGIFTLWSHEPAAPPQQPKSRLIRNYVHSKVAVVDDKWATVGSANLDGVSLKNSEHAMLLDKIALGLASNQAIDRNRASEMNAVILKSIPGHPDNDRVSFLRRRLWSEHLGFKGGGGSPDPSHTSVSNRPADGWLSRWKERAQAKLDGLKSDPPTVHDSRILPFPHADGDVPFRVENAETYLHNLGINVGRLTLEDEVRQFNFKTGAWK
jgi:phosphatidylserine/phosphatidylglycerophosphate/cardiolipin synthase-like enzyme